MIFDKILAMLFGKKKQFVFPFDLSESSYIQSVNPNPLIRSSNVKLEDKLEFSVTFMEDVPSEEIAKKAWEFFAVDVDRYGNERRVYTETLVASVDIATNTLTISGIHDWKNTMKFYCVDKMTPVDGGSSGKDNFDWSSPTTIIGDTEWTRFDLDYHDNALWYGTAKLMDIDDNSGIYRTDELFVTHPGGSHELIHDGVPETQFTIAAIKRLFLNPANPLPGGWHVSTANDWVKLYFDGLGYHYAYSGILTFRGWDEVQRDYRYTHAIGGSFPDKWGETSHGGELPYKAQMEIFDRSCWLEKTDGSLVHPRDGLHTSFKSHRLSWTDTSYDVINGHQELTPIKYGYEGMRYFVSGNAIDRFQEVRAPGEPYTPHDDGFVEFPYSGYESYRDNIHETNFLYYDAGLYYGYEDRGYVSPAIYYSILADGTIKKDTIGINRGGQRLDKDMDLFSIRLCRSII